MSFERYTIGALAKVRENCSQKGLRISFIVFMARRSYGSVKRVRFGTFIEDTMILCLLVDSLLYGQWLKMARR
jgi:hypothetical protein